MRAAVVPELGGRVEIRELPVPEPGPGQVLVRIAASGRVPARVVFSF
jgi:alcohol dehydrogenase, propanol-preferring